MIICFELFIEVGVSLSFGNVLIIIQKNSRVGLSRLIHSLLKFDITELILSRNFPINVCSFLHWLFLVISFSSFCSFIFLLFSIILNYDPSTPATFPVSLPRYIVCPIISASSLSRFGLTKLLCLECTCLQCSVESVLRVCVPLLFTSLSHSPNTKSIFIRHWFRSYTNRLCEFRQFDRRVFTVPCINFLIFISVVCL